MSAVAPHCCIGAGLIAPQYGHETKTYARCCSDASACKDADEGRGAGVVGGCAHPPIHGACLDAVREVDATPWTPCRASAARTSGARRRGCGRISSEGKRVELVARIRAVVGVGVSIDLALVGLVCPGCSYRRHSKSVTGFNYCLWSFHTHGHTFS